MGTHDFTDSTGVCEVIIPVCQPLFQVLGIGHFEVGSFSSHLGF